MEGTDFNKVLNTAVDFGKTIKELEHENEVPKVYTLNGRSYVTGDVRRLKEPEPERITVSTLTGLVDYCIANVDGLEPRDLICHVVSPTHVEVYSKLFGDFHQRKVFIEAKANHVPTIRLNEFLPVEDFNLMLMSCFIDDSDRAKVLSVSGNITASAEVNNADDGVSQEVTVKAGIRKVENADVPNPVILKPFRTFTDVPQPDGKFVFRIKDANGIKCGLFDATGGAWKGEAMDSIKHYLVRELATDAPEGQQDGNPPAPSAADIRVIA